MDIGNRFCTSGKLTPKLPGRVLTLSAHKNEFFVVNYFFRKNIYAWDLNLKKMALHLFWMQAPIFDFTT